MARQADAKSILNSRFTARLCKSRRGPSGEGEMPRVIQCTTARLMRQAQCSLRSRKCCGRPKKTQFFELLGRFWSRAAAVGRSVESGQIDAALELLFEEFQPSLLAFGPGDEGPPCVKEVTDASQPSMRVMTFPLHSHLRRCRPAVTGSTSRYPTSPLCRGPGREPKPVGGANGGPACKSRPPSRG